MNTYEVTYRAACPNGDLQDHYNVTIQTEQMLSVESILASLKALPGKAYQEDLATQLRNALGAPLTMTGWHHGVKITCERP